MESTASSAAWQYGVLGVVALVFGYAIIHLFRALRNDQAAMRELEKARAEERATALTDRETLRAEYEAKHREVVESYAKALREERDANRAHEDAARREFAEIMERLGSELARMSDSHVTVFNKFYDRFVGPERSKKR